MGWVGLGASCHDPGRVWGLGGFKGFEGVVSGWST